jgi:hypothetical protein
MSKLPKTRSIYDVDRLTSSSEIKLDGRTIGTITDIRIEDGTAHVEATITPPKPIESITFEGTITGFESIEEIPKPKSKRLRHTPKEKSEIEAFEEALKNL